jgi:hypothetical protein
MRAPLALLLAIEGCASHPANPSVAAPPALTPPPAPSSVPTPAPPPPLPALTSFDVLASRASALAPGMHEVARGDLASDSPSPARDLVRADGADTCTRVAFAAQPAVRASLVDGRGNLLAEVSSATDAAIGIHGPSCVRKGDAITLRVEGTPPWALRFVAWASP